MFKTRAALFAAIDSVQLLLNNIEGTPKDWYRKPKGQYRQFLMNVRLSNGHIGEIQFHVEEVYNVKNGAEHDLYKEEQTLERQMKQRTLTKYTPEEMTRLREIRKIKDKLYKEAWDKTP